MAKHIIVGVAVAILMVVGSLMPLSLSTEPVETVSIEGRYLVYTNDVGGLFAVAGGGLTVLQTYDSYVLVESTDDASRRVIDSGYDVGQMRDATTIGLTTYAFDTRYGEPSIPDELRINSYSGDGLHIVQFIGPVTEAWLDDVAALGIEVYGYLPNFAFIVMASAVEMESARVLSCVEWTGIYQPAYKLAPGLAPGLIQVTLMDGAGSRESVDAIFAATEVLDYAYAESTGTHDFFVVADSKDIIDIANMPDVVRIGQHDENALMDETSSEITGGIWAANTPYGAYGNYANIAGWDGTNVVVAVADTGLSSGAAGNAGHIGFNTNRVVGGKDYSGTGSWRDGHGHGTHCAGIVAANGNVGTGIKYGTTNYYLGAGTAPDAKLYGQKIFTDAGSGTGIPTTQAGWDTFFQDAYGAGAYVHSNSWGENPGDSAYEANDIYYDQHVRDSATSTAGLQPMIITVAAGNAGSAAGTIGSPASAKNVITVGASESYHLDATTYGFLGSNTDCNDVNTIISFSSRGLDDDTKVKPDVVAPGTGIVSTHSSYMSTAPNLYGFYSGDNRYEWCSGTSQANPHIAGAAAVLVDWWQAGHSGTYPMPAMVKALMINTAIDMGTADIPNGNEGWGRAYLPTIVNPSVNVFNYDNPQVLATGQTYTTQVAYHQSTQPLKITMVYTDAPGTALANPTLVNNLNLRVTAPGGQVWYGNAFSNGYSVHSTGASSTNLASENWDRNADMWDDVNNVECVYIPTTGLQSGTYTIEVIGYNVPTAVVTGGQDFALTIYNAITPGTTATATGPIGGPTNDNTVTLTYTNSGTPTSVNLYYTKSTASPYTWVLAGNDATVDGSYAYTITAGSGTSGWLASAVGGGSTEPSPPGTTIAPEATPYILDVTAPAAPTALTVQHYGVDQIPNMATYTYVGTTAAAGPHDAYYLDMDDSSAAELTTPNTRTEATDAQYTNIAASEDTRWAGTAPGNADEIGWECRYTITQAASAVTMINLTFEGQSASASCIYTCFAWNAVASSWDTIGTTMTFTTANTDYTMTRSITTNPDNYVSGGIVRCVFYGSSANAVTRWDYSQCVIHYNVPVGTLADNTLNWTHTGTDVSVYNVYCSALNTGPWDATTLVTSVPVGTNTYCHVDKGQADSTRWWYVVRAQDASGNVETNTNAVQEPGSTEYWANIAVVAGWNLISVPIVGTTTLPAALTDLNGTIVQWTRVMWYNPRTPADPWKQYNTAWASSLNDLTAVNNTMGVWLFVTTANDGIITVGGTGYTRPTSTNIVLKAGWNLVGFPSDDAAFTVANLKGACPSVTLVEQYNSGQTYLTLAMADATAFAQGKAYWVFNNGADTTWTKAW